TMAVIGFIRSIHKDDVLFLMTFANRPDLRQDFTDDRERLGRALRHVVVGGGTALYDAMDEGLQKIKRGKHEKKAILLITDGEDTSRYIAFEQARSLVRESELLVYCLGISPVGGYLSERRPGQYPGPSGPRDPRTGPSIGFPFPGIPGVPGWPYPGGGRRIPARPALPPQQHPRGRTHPG